MPSTPNFAIPYPALSDSPNGPSQMQAMATQIDTVMPMRQVSSTAAVTSPYEGQFIYNSTDNLIYRRTGSVWVPTIQHLVALASSDLTVGTSDTDIAGATITVTTQVANAVARVAADYDWDCTVTGTGYCYGNLYVDGTRQAGEAIFVAQSAETRIPGSKHWTITLATAGSHTLKLRGRKDSGSGTGIFRAAGTSIVIDLYQ